MTTEHSELEVTPRATDAFVVDTDFHAGPSRDMEPLIPYIDDDRIVEKIRVDSTMPRPSRISAGYAKSSESGFHSHGRALDGESVVDVMERFAIDVVIVAPGTNFLPAIQYPRLKDAVCRATNDFILDRITPADDAIKTHIALPIWNPEACVDELDRLGDEKDVVGAYAWYGPFNELLGKPAYDPMFERLVELDLPLAIHTGGSTTPPVDLVGDSMRTRTEALGTLPAFYGIADIINMIVTGVFDKFPDLRVICQETGVTWLPFVANRLNEIYYTQPDDVKLTERLFDMGKEYLDADPGEYFFDNCYLSTQPIALPNQNKRAMLKLCRAKETFMYSSDWPHHTIDPVNWVFDSVIENELRKQILQRNAEACYRL